MNIFLFIICGLTAFMAVGTQFGQDQQKIRGRHFPSKKRTRHLRNWIKPMTMPDFKGFLTALVNAELKDEIKGGVRR